MKKSIEEEFGYKVNNIKIVYEESYTDIEKIELSIQKNDIEIVKPIEIGESTSSEDFSDVKKYISENYGISNDKIFIN